MTRRTIAEARTLLDENVIPRVSDYWASAYRAELANVEQTARTYVDEHAATHERTVRDRRNATLRDLTVVRERVRGSSRRGGRRRHRRGQVGGGPAEAPRTAGRGGRRARGCGAEGRVGRRDGVRSARVLRRPGRTPTALAEDFSC